MQWMDEERWGPAEDLLREAASGCEPVGEGRRALLLLAMLHLDPRNPAAVPDSAALMAIRHLRLEAVPAPERLLSESLYVLALGRGADPTSGSPESDEVDAAADEEEADEEAEEEEADEEGAAEDDAPAPEEDGAAEVEEGPERADEEPPAEERRTARFSGCPPADRPPGDTLDLPGLTDEAWSRSPAGVESALRGRVETLAERNRELERRLEELEAEIRRIRRILGGDSDAEPPGPSTQMRR